MASNYVMRAMLGLAFAFALACIAIMSFGNRDHHAAVVSDASGNLSDNSIVAMSLLRRGMVDASSRRFGRAKRAFDAARRAANGDPEMVQRIDVENMKLEAVLKEGSLR